MSIDEVVEEVRRCVRNAAHGQGYRYVILPPGEGEVVGVVAIDAVDPSRRGAAVSAAGALVDSARVCWWLTDLHAGGPLDAAVAELARTWLEDARPNVARA